MRELGFVAFFYIVLMSAFPYPPPQLRSVTIIMKWMGLWQSWNMFAPYPASVSNKFEVVFEMPDGTQSSMFLPSRLDPYDYSGLVLEKFRKWSAEALVEENMKHLLPRAVLYAARKSHHENFKRAKIIHYYQDVKTSPSPLKLEDYKGKEVLYDSETAPKK